MILKSINQTINITTKNINENIKVIEHDLIFDEYYRNNNSNETSYIVIRHYDDDEQYIECLLLNINIFDYIKAASSDNKFSANHLKKFDLFYHNGFLGVYYYYDKYISRQKIIDFFEKYDEYFIKNCRFCKSPIKLKDHVLELYNKIIEQIKIRRELDELLGQINKT